jgi:peptidoglycan/xylan/chitin deacetylase (PgdA/CDA1 family)
VYSLPASLRGVEWNSLPTSRKIVALTFDGGSGSQGLSAILAELAKERVPATFFLTGVWVQSNAAGARSIAADPSTSIGNHTWDHPYCTTLSDAELRSELTRTETEIRSFTGRDPRPLFRFPYGDRNAHTIAVVNALGYGSIRWTVDTLGWEGKSGGQSTATVLQRVKAAERPGEIVLMHIGAAPDGSTLDADALPAVIAQLRSDGYGFVAIWDFIAGVA